MFPYSTANSRVLLGINLYRKLSGWPFPWRPRLTGLDKDTTGEKPKNEGVLDPGTQIHIDLARIFRIHR